MPFITIVVYLLLNSLSSNKKIITLYSEWLNGTNIRSSSATSSDLRSVNNKDAILTSEMVTPLQIISFVTTL